MELNDTAKDILGIEARKAKAESERLRREFNEKHEEYEKAKKAYEQAFERYEALKEFYFPEHITIFPNPTGPNAPLFNKGIQW